MNKINKSKGNKPFIKLKSGVCVTLDAYKVLKPKQKFYGDTDPTQGEIAINFRWLFSKNWGKISGEDRTWDYGLGFWDYFYNQTGFKLTSARTGWDGDKTVEDTLYFKKDFPLEEGDRQNLFSYVKGILKELSN